MHVDDLEFVIELERNNIAKLIELETGKSITDPPYDLLSSLEQRYEKSLTEGVCYNDISWLKNFTILDPLTKYLSVADYTSEATLIGVSNYRSILQGCISILKMKE